MRKIILNVAVSLDGYIEGPKGEIDWCFTNQDYGMHAFMNRIDTILIGRKSYELMIQMGEKLLPGIRYYVFSRTLTSVAEGGILVQKDMEKKVHQLKQQAGKDIWLFGGADLVHAFFTTGLVDEMFLSVHPVLLGGGKPLFKNLKERIKYHLTNAKTYDTGLVQLWYQLDQK